MTSILVGLSPDSGPPAPPPPARRPTPAEPAMPTDPAPAPAPTAGLLRQLVILQIPVYVLVGLLCYREFVARPAAPPDAVQSSSVAYIEGQPRALKAVAAGLRGGSIKPEDTDDAIRRAALPTAQKLADALKADPDRPAALERAAAAMEGRLR